MSIISTRLLISDKKRQFLDLKIGNPMMQKVTRMETTQAKEISSLIYQYVALYSSAKQEGQGLSVVLRNNQEVSRTWAPVEDSPGILQRVGPHNVQKLGVLGLATVQKRNAMQKIFVN